ncbi:MAG: TonB-dependent receptor [Dysgonamonadaceae bacterium]|jgi:outer membrane receptor protein involved in Fe transport|nr:TonB-dependent receptor [Dysgonamonadaceae bacterium]
MKKRSFFILLLFIICFSSFADSPKSVVSGMVKDKEGKPIEFVSVSADQSQQSTMTNEKGEYALTLSSGKHRLRFYHLNFVKSEQVVLLSNGEREQVDVVLKDNTNTLSEVVVRGKSEKENIETKGFAVHVIDMQKAALQSIQTNELLDRTAGVRVRQNGGLGAATNYNLNGMSGHSVRIFVDGIPASTYGASFSLNSIPPSLIERIEIYKGVIPAYLSDDALGGAINVILKKGMRNTLTASVLYGSFNTQQANFDALFRDKKTGFTVKASGFYNYSDNDYEVWGKFVRNILPNGRYDYVRAKRFNDAYKSIGGRMELGFTGVKWADRFYIGYNGSDAYNEIQHGAYMSIPYKGRHTDAQAHVFSLNYRKTNVVVNGLEFTLNGMHSRRKEVVTDTVKWNYNWFGEISRGLDGNPILRPSGAQQGAPTLNHINRNITTVRAGVIYDIQRNHKIILNHILYNVNRTQQDFMRSAVERDFIGTRDLRKNITSLAYEMKAVEGKLTTTLFGKYYQQDIAKMDPVLKAVEGQTVRVEETLNNRKTATGYGLAASYSVLPKLLLLTSAERAVRMPSESEVFGSPGENIVENTGLRAEVSDNLNVGLKAGPFSAGKHQLDAAVSVFLRDTKDKIVQRINPRLNDAVQTDPFENLGKTKSQGFELELNYTYDRNLNVALNMSRFNSVFNIQYDSNGREYDYYNKQLPNEPFFTVNGMVKYALYNLVQKRSTLNVYYNCGFVESFQTTWLALDDFKVPRQFIQDMGLNYVFPSKRFVVGFDVKNILDKQAYDNFAVQKPGRAFYLKLNYIINNF